MNAAETEANLINGYYTRPAILDLAGDVAGRRILDVGCGSAPLSAALRDRGAVVTGLDSSAGMLELARRRPPTIRRSHTFVRTLECQYPGLWWKRDGHGHHS